MGMASDVSTYTDATNWPVTVEGIYYWAVITHFETGDSEAGISNGLEFVNLYSTTFTVDDGTDPIDGAMLTIDGETHTLTDGTITLEIAAGDYPYTATAVGFDDFTSTYTVTTDATQLVEIHMTETTYTVTFSVEAGNGAIDATVDGTSIMSGDDVVEGSELVFTATPDATWAVLNWYLNTVAVGSTDATYTIASLDADTDVKVEFSIVDGVNNELNSNISVYPNPSNGKFTISVNGTYTMQVVDITGKIISTQEIYNTESLDIQDAGAYIIRITNDVETLNYKVIVK